MTRLLRNISRTLALGLITTACHRESNERHEQGEPHGAALSEADANSVTDATVATWQSMDAAKIDALYAPDVVGFDVFAAPLSTDRANWTKNQQGFAAAKFDKVTLTSSKTQILDDEDFIFSSVADATSSTGPMKTLTIRCTDVFRKQAAGKFLIVNEHCSLPPKGA